MKKDKLYKGLVSIGVLIMSLLPKVNKELYVSSAGNIGSLDFFLAIVIIFGLFANWKYLKEIVLVLFILRIMFATSYLFFKMVAFDFASIQMGWVIEFSILLVGIFVLIQLRKQEKLNRLFIKYQNAL